MLKKTLIRAALGFLIGIIMGDGIAIVTGILSEGDFRPVNLSLEQMCGSMAAAFLVQTVLSGVYGAICFGAISVHEIERLPMALASVLHCLLIVILFVPVSFCLGWCVTIGEYLIMAGIQIAVYFMIWLILYFSYRKEVKKLNELQQQIHQRNGISDKEEKNNEKETI